MELQGVVHAERISEVKCSNGMQCMMGKIKAMVSLAEVWKKCL
jgi:hypothetical protein